MQAGYERLIQIILKLGVDYLVVTVERNTPWFDLLDTLKSA
jgi:hypothetical protein